MNEEISRIRPMLKTLRRKDNSAHDGKGKHQENLKKWSCGGNGSKTMVRFSAGCTGRNIYIPTKCVGKWEKNKV